MAHALATHRSRRGVSDERYDSQVDGRVALRRLRVHVADTRRPRASRDDDVERAFAAARARATAATSSRNSRSAPCTITETRTPRKAIDWFQKAAAQGYAPAAFQMGQLYEFGFGVAQDDRTAFAWYSSAAAHGSATAQRAVGDVYRKGRGVAGRPGAGRALGTDAGRRR